MSEYQYHEWQTIDRHQAVELLRRLRHLADYQRTRDEFDRRFSQRRERYKSRTSFVQRLQRVGLV